MKRCRRSREERVVRIPWGTNDFLGSRQASETHRVEEFLGRLEALSARVLLLSTV